MKNSTLIKITVITCAIILALFGLHPCCAESVNGLYPRTAAVAGFDYDRDVVIATDWAGLEWEFEGIEDWEIGDLVSLMMYDNGMPNTILDDEIMLAYYGGWTILED